MDIHILISCTVNILQLLIKQYELKKISQQCFFDNVNLKLWFIYENLDYVESRDDKARINETIKKCSDILLGYYMFRT